MKRYLSILLAIILLGSFLRFYNLGVVPGLHRDEAFLGYNAYAILKTGKDMSDTFLPMHLESFIYSPAGYSYLSIPFIAIFGLNEFSVRVPSAFFGILTIVIIYLLGRELFKSHTKVQDRNSNQILPIVASAILAISPWHVNLSRTATENVVATFLIVLGIFCYFVFISKNKQWLLLASFASFGLSLLMYQAPRAFLPIFIPILFMLFSNKTKLFAEKKILLLYFLVIILPLFLILFSPQLSLRIRSLSIFHNEQTKLILQEQIANDGSTGFPYLATRLIHNKIAGHSLLFLENYFKHFSFDFLFLDQGFPDRYRVPKMGLLYIFELPLIIFGLFYLLGENRKIGIFLLSWILITPIGSALTFDDIPNMQRALIGLPAYSFLSAYGLISIYNLIKNRNRKVSQIVALSTGLIIIYSVGYYFTQYYAQAVYYKTWYRQDGYKELVYKVNGLLPKYDKVVVTNRESAPTIFFLFFSKYDPSFFQKDTYLSSHRSFDRMNFGKYEFTEDECPLRKIKTDGTVISSAVEGVLYVDSALCKEIPESAKKLADVRRKDGSLVFYILEE